MSPFGAMAKILPRGWGKKKECACVCVCAYVCACSQSHWFHLSWIIQDPRVALPLLFPWARPSLFGLLSQTSLTRARALVRWHPPACLAGEAADPGTFTQERYLKVGVEVGGVLPSANTLMRDLPEVEPRSLRLHVRAFPWGACHSPGPSQTCGCQRPAVLGK